MSLPDRVGLEYELVIVGAGTAGMEAALAAASAGMQVALVDRQAQQLAISGLSDRLEEQSLSLRS